MIGSRKATSCRLWLMLATVMIVVAHVDAIRVYEGTNFPNPVSKPSKQNGLSKKSSYISKRSWNSGEEKLTKAVNKRGGIEGAPALYKIKFNDKNLMQYLKYIKEIPRLEEYTFCLWYKSDNLSHDQTLFSYSLSKDEVLLRFWLNAVDSSLRMSIRDHPVFKVPTVIGENRWYHICQSWNGVLGEWQVFLDGRKIGGGVLSHYKGTYIPEGGEITLGQELIGLKKRPNDRMDGEIFGFNLVDEAVPLDEGVFINSQYKPNFQGVPPFKKLPPIKKTYQEIKAYISSLPSDPSDLRKKSEVHTGQTPHAMKKPKDTYSLPPKRTRGNQRLRYPPLRKVVVYNRDDRQLILDQVPLELNKTKPAVHPNATAEAKKSVQPFDIHYSIHSYKFGKEDERRPKSYEIYENVEDDGERVVSEEELTKEQSLERKARQNFNLFTAREANKVYTLSSSVRDARKPLFHFETTTETPNRRSFVPETTTKSLPSGTTRTASAAIPVHEPEITPERKRRSADEEKQPGPFTTTTQDTADSNGFRRLPQMPDEFINIFTQNASASEIEKKLNEFFPQENTSQDSNVVAETTEAVGTTPAATTTANTYKAKAATAYVTTVATAYTERFTTEVPIPPFSPIPPQYMSRKSPPEMQNGDRLSNPGPVNFPVIRESQPRPSAEGRPPEAVERVAVAEKRYETQEERARNAGSFFGGGKLWQVGSLQNKNTNEGGRGYARSKCWVPTATAIPACKKTQEEFPVPNRPGQTICTRKLSRMMQSTYFANRNNNRTSHDASQQRRQCQCQRGGPCSKCERQVCGSLRQTSDDGRNNGMETGRRYNELPGSCSGHLRRHR